MAEEQALRQRVAALRREYELLQQAVSQKTPRPLPSGTGSAGTVVGTAVHQEGSSSPGATAQAAHADGVNPRAELAAADPALPNLGDAKCPTTTPPGLEFLGREPPSAARALGPPKREALSAKGVSSSERSSYFAEYRHGRVPGTPGLDQLRSQSNLVNAPSQFAVGSTKRTLFASDASWTRDLKGSGVSQPRKRARASP